MPDEPVIELDLRDRIRRGVIVALDDRVAAISVVEPGGVEDEWYFPSAMVPPELRVDDPVVLEGAGRTLRIVAAAGQAAAHAQAVDPGCGRADQVADEFQSVVD